MLPLTPPAPCTASLAGRRALAAEASCHRTPRNPPLRSLAAPIARRNGRRWGIDVDPHHPAPCPP